MIRIYQFSEVAPEDVFARTSPTAQVDEAVSAIIAEVRERGDKALFDFTEKFDGVKLSSLAVSGEEIEQARAAVEPEFLRILERAAHNIRRFHERQVRNSFILNDEDGIVMGQKVIPLDRAGLYVPGGTAAYPSTVLMDAIPAKIAGVREVVMTTPPGKDGRVISAILAAASAAGVDRIYRSAGRRLLRL